MPGVRLSEHFGLVIRKEALSRCHVDRTTLRAIMEVDSPFDEDEHLVSFGPHFGGEAMQTFFERLEAVGLQYGDDVLDIADTLPDWLQLYAQYAPTNTTHIATLLPASLPAESEHLLEIWRILEALTVSLDRIGMYETLHGTEAGQRALLAYFTPPLFARIAQARTRIVDMLIRRDPAWDAETERQAQDEDIIGYWQGEGTSTAG